MHLHQQASMILLSIVLAFAIISVHAFTPSSCAYKHRHGAPLCMTTSDDSSSPASSSTQTQSSNSDTFYLKWAQEHGVEINPKLSLREPTPEERGKGGLEAIESIQALEVLAKIPRNLIITAVDAPTRAMEAAANANNFSWATDLTAAALVALHPLENEQEEGEAKQQFVASWKSGGWATEGADLGPPEANFGAKDVTGSLMATGSDNDHNIYAKFRMPCHPVLLRASNGLAVLTQCTEEEARDVLTCRGRSYRIMRDALEGLVLTPTGGRTKGSNREKRCWDVADMLSRVLARATTLHLSDSDNKEATVEAIVPLHERLSHASTENSKLIASSDDELLLVATKDIATGDAITRNYSVAPRLDQDTSEGPLHLLVQFGLPPNAWEV